MQIPESEIGEARRKVTLLQGFIKSSIDDVTNKRRGNQRKATTIKLLILCLSGGATVLLGLNFGSDAEVPMKNIAFAFSSLVTVFNALEPFFNYRALWIEHERATANFYHVKDRLEFYVAGLADDEIELREIDRFYDEYEHVWTTLNQAWVQQRLMYEGGAKPTPDHKRGQTATKGT